MYRMFRVYLSLQMEPLEFEKDISTQQNACIFKLLHFQSHAIEQSSVTDDFFGAEVVLGSRYLWFSTEATREGVTGYWDTMTSPTLRIRDATRASESFTIVPF